MTGKFLKSLFFATFCAVLFGGCVGGEKLPEAEIETRVSKAAPTTGLNTLIYLNAGELKKVETGMLFEIYRKKRRAGTIRIIAVYPFYSYGKANLDSLMFPIKRGDRALYFGKKR